jgi:hypothetical protein
MTDDDAIDIGEDMAPRKRKTTYNREHPTENPKPPKRSKAEIRAAAAEKKAISIAKKKEKASLQAAVELDKQEKKQKSMKEVAAMEDAIRRKQKQYQLQAERPDLQTTKTYQSIQEAHEASLAVENASTTEEIQQNTGVVIPPQYLQVLNTDANGGLPGVEKNINFDQLDDEDEDEDDMYMPAVGMDDDDDLEEELEEELDEEINFSDEGQTSKKKRAKKEKVRIPISQEFV